MSQFKYSVLTMERTSGSRFLRNLQQEQTSRQDWIRQMRSVLHLQWASFNQVKVLKENGYGSHGEYVGLDVKAMRTTKDEDSYKHLENRNFEALKMYVMNLLMGIE